MRPETEEKTPRPPRRKKKRRKAAAPKSTPAEVTTPDRVPTTQRATQVDVGDVADTLKHSQNGAAKQPPAARGARKKPRTRKVKRRVRPAAAELIEGAAPTASSTAESPSRAARKVTTDDLPAAKVSEDAAGARAGNLPTGSTSKVGGPETKTSVAKRPERRWARRRAKSGGAPKSASADGADTGRDGAADATAVVPAEPKVPTAKRDSSPTKRKDGASRAVRHRTRGGKARRAEPVEADDEAEVVAASDADVEDDLDDEFSPVAVGAERTMLINVSAGDECRIAVVHQGRLEELFIERASAQSHVGNIYKGRITNVEPSIQAAFIDFGLSKNGFLHISDVQPQYFPNHLGEPEDVGRKIPRHSRPPIQKCFHRGQQVIVQITKEGVGTKGPTLTTYLSIPGRFLVVMPGMSHHGVSRKIEDESDRRKMRDLLDELKLPTGMGFILRTAGLGRTKRELQRDLNYLLRLWKTVVDRIKTLPTPVELYQESDLVTRTIRDVYSAEFTQVIVDDAETAKKAGEFLQIAMPRSKASIELYSDREPLFHRFRIEEQIEKINMRHVPLPLGGSLVIDTTEAMVAIDVNSGRFRSPEDAEETAFQINLEAAEEIARQLRLRDLGGLIVCDFIDMRLDRHKRAVERALRNALKAHKERARILRMSSFGLIEMTRQRQGPSIKRNIYFECQHCKGSGLVKMPESVVLDVMRIIQLAANHGNVQKVTVTVASEVAFQILNRRRSVLGQIEAETDKEVVILGDTSFISDQVEYVCEDGRGQPVQLGLGRQDSGPA